MPTTEEHSAYVYMDATSVSTCLTSPFGLYIQYTVLLSAIEIGRRQSVLTQPKVKER